MRTFILSLFFWLFMLFSSILIFPVYLISWVVVFPFDRRIRVAHFLTGLWAFSYIAINPWWHIHITGREHIDRKNTYVIVCNHQSLLDVLVLFGLKRHFRWVAKIEIFRIPIAGWVMLLNHYLWVKRGDKQSAAKMLYKAEKTILKGNSIMIFPEGTRTRDGNLNPFKDGAFNLALDTKVNIVPVIIDGTFEALPKTGLVLRPNQYFVVNILNEIDISNYSKSDLEELKKHTWQLMNENLKKIRMKKFENQQDQTPSDTAR